MLTFCDAFSRLGLQTRDQFQWVQIASDELPLCLRSASDGNQTGFKWDQITPSYPQGAAGSAQIAFRVFNVAFTVIDRFEWLRWLSGEPRRDFRWSSKRVLGVPGSDLGIRLVSLALDQMGVRWVADGVLMPLR